MAIARVLCSQVIRTGAQHNADSGGTGEYSSDFPERTVTLSGACKASRNPLWQWKRPRKSYKIRVNHSEPHCHFIRSSEWLPCMPFNHARHLRAPDLPARD